MQAGSINERVKRIKGYDDEINRFVEEYKPFIAACVQKATGRYVKYGEDDELSIAMIAFVEAIKSYEGLKGNFLSFAQNVIKRRLIDYYRKEKKHDNVISINEHFKEDEEEIDLSADESIERFSDEEIGSYRKWELEQLKKDLKEWEISFVELAEASPKHDKTRRQYAEVIRFLLSQLDLIKLMKQKKYLPIAEIEKSVKIPRKTIERARKYIIAVVIIMTGDYQYVRDYINVFDK